MAPLPAKLVKKLRQADALVVERIFSGNETPFSNLPKCPPLVERLSAGQLSALEKRVSELGMPLIHFDNQPLWQIAMVLQATQAQRLGLRPDYGIDYQLLQAAREMSLPVQELEGAKHQSRTTLRSARWRDGAARRHADALAHQRTAFAGDDRLVA
ncbi:GumN family protein [Salmonella enterica subsp. enterica]|uniref:GumN family protein n=1 Tax=Salmonella enterica I TaxID=59201 RepID=A0A379WZ68_SALET|nr:GumN family protein [Salmonella enterica subsp. enterica]